MANIYLGSNRESEKGDPVWLRYVSLAKWEDGYGVGTKHRRGQIAATFTVEGLEVGRGVRVEGTAVWHEDYSNHGLWRSWPDYAHLRRTSDSPRADLPVTEKEHSKAVDAIAGHLPEITEEARQAAIERGYEIAIHHAKAEFERALERADHIRLAHTEGPPLTAW